MIKVSEIKKSFGGIQALNNCSLEIAAGKITAIIGPNGSGKTTLFNILSNIVNADAGKILFNEEDITSLQDFEIARRGFSRTFQEVRLFKNLKVRDHLEIALSDHYESLRKTLFKKEQNKDEKIKIILVKVGLEKERDSYVSELSYGQRKLLDLAIAITRNHKVLLLDEPVAGVNPALRKEIRKILQDLKQKGETIAVIEHDMNFVMDIADVVYVLDNGKVIAKGPPRKIQKDRKVLESYMGE